jgi:uroporphyrinogen decarboxylase
MARSSQFIKINVDFVRLGNIKVYVIKTIRRQRILLYPELSMIPRDRVIRTLNHQPIDRAPRDLWLGSGVDAAHPDEVAEINVRFPSDFLHIDPSVETVRGPSKRQKVNDHKEGIVVDAWGCVWKAVSLDSPAVVVNSPLGGAASMADFHPPAELLDAARFAKIDAACEGTGRFTLAAAGLRPLERLCQLRGSETALRELAEGNVELRDLLSRLREFSRREAEQWAKTEIDGVVLGDDVTWPSQSQTSLNLWRSLVRPFFQDFCSVLHKCDKFAFFLAHGPVYDVLDDLIEIGIDAVHAEWPLEEFDKLASSQRGRIVFWGGLENRRIEPPAQPGDVRDAVHRVRKAADFGSGGIISQISWTGNTPLRNVVAYFEQWLVPLPVVV